MPIQRAADFSQRQIVRTDQSYGPALEQSTNHALRTDAAIIRVCALQQFVQQEQQRRVTACEVKELAEAGDLRIKARASLLQRIVDADAGTDLQRR